MPSFPQGRTCNDCRCKTTQELPQGRAWNDCRCKATQELHAKWQRKACIATLLSVHVCGRTNRNFISSILKCFVVGKRPLFVKAHRKRNTPPMSAWMCKQISDHRCAKALSNTRQPQAIPCGMEQPQASTGNPKQPHPAPGSPHSPRQLRHPLAIQSNPKQLQRARHNSKQPQHATSPTQPMAQAAPSSPNSLRAPRTPRQHQVAQGSTR